MANAVEVDIANAVVAELNDPARSWTGQFTAVRKWLPIYRDGDLTTLRVAVIPLTIDEERLTRGGLEKMEYGIGVDFQVEVSTAPDADNAPVDLLTKMVQDVHDFFRAPHNLATLPACKVTEAKRADIYVEEPLYTHSIWETYVTLKVLIAR